MPGKMPGEWQVSTDWGQPGSILVKNNEMFWVYQSQPNLYKINQAIASNFIFFKEKEPHNIKSWTK